MGLIAVIPIVEGHGETQAVPLLVRRVFAELFDYHGVNVLKPIRTPRSRLAKSNELLKAVSLAALKLNDVDAERKFALILFDSDKDPACQLAPAIVADLKANRPDVDVAVVLAVHEFETWFVAAAESLSKYIAVAPKEIPHDPEASGAKKRWVEDHFRSHYAETINQPALTAEMDLHLCRSRSRSFDKLCRELEKRLLPKQ